MNRAQSFLRQHHPLTRRHFVKAAAAAAAGISLGSWAATADGTSPEMEKAIEALEPYFTPAAQFRDVSRGQPLPHTLPAQTKRAVGMTRETWRCEVVSDPEHPATLRHPLTIKDGSALDFAGLMALAQKRAVRFAKTMTCLNIGCPLGTGIWEGVPLRDIVWLAEPRENVRRIFYSGYHNDDPQQMFRSSLPIDRVLEDLFDLPPVILCYKLNGAWLESERGGPVRMVVPEAYGFKSIKWLNQIVLTNLFHANDTYAEGNNDVDSTLKTFAATLSIPRELKAGEPLPVTGYAQVGLAGLSKVQVWIQSNEHDLPQGDPYFAAAPWQDARILPPPKRWAALPEEKIPADTLGFNSATGQANTWPMRLTKVHWAALLPGLAAGEYTFRCRTIDQKGNAQPWPRPFQKSGHAAIEAVNLRVTA